MSMIRRLFLATLALMLTGSPALAARGPEPFAIAGHRVAPGKRADIRIIVPAGSMGKPSSR